MLKRRLALLALPVLIFGVVGTAGAAAPNGEDIYTTRCAVCHANPHGRMPSREQLATLPPDEIFQAARVGMMQAQAEGLSIDEVRAVVTFLTGKEPGTAPQPDPKANMCKDDGGPIDLKESHWSGWGRGAENARYQIHPGIKVEDVPKLKLKWAFAYPGFMVYGQPTVAGNRVFVTSMAGEVFALNAKTGCTFWSFDNQAASRTAMSIGEITGGAAPKAAVWFGDDKGAVTALDATTGKVIWKTQVDSHPLAQITGAPQLVGGRLYVPMSSREEGAGIDDRYPCCTFRGSISALDAATGKEIWKSYTVGEPAKVFKKNAAGADLMGPAGVSSWTAPAIDEKRGVLYATTGDSYTDIDVDDSDALIALDLKTGTRKWMYQALAKDNYLVDCPGADGVNCPTPPGPDLDFNASPILRNLANGKTVLLATAKTGEAYAFDPDENGKLLWKKKLGDANPLGGIGWGSAADDDYVYIAFWTGFMTKPGEAPGGIAALKLATGETVWETKAEAGTTCAWGPVNCFNAQLAGLALIPGAVFTGSDDGHLRAYSTKDGTKIWETDTAGAHDAVNGVAANGGSISGSGPVVAEGELFVNSGYGRFLGKSGNALLVYSVDGK